ncbi:MAG: hypothetical protein ACTHK4_17855 [Mycobacteriales bacterium]
MSPVIILGLVLMWAVVLVPMWMRRHDEVEETRSVDRFSAAMHTLSRYDDRQRDGVSGHRSRSLEVHVSGASAPDAIAARHQRGAAHRRMRALGVLMLVDVVFLLIAAFTGVTLVWVLQVMLDLASVAFVVHLRRMAVLAAAARRRAARQRRDSQLLEEALAEPEWQEGITVRRAEPVYAATAAPSRAVADDVFDQTALSEDAEAPQYASAQVAATDGFFDQEAEVAPVAEREPSFVEAGVQRTSRVVIESEERPETPAAEAVGGSPWEPVPVPKPTYAMKPAAPQRSARRRTSEPILPAVEPVVELESDDDLEAILDRRWAVND